MNPVLRRVLYPQGGPVAAFWRWIHRQLDPLLARAYLKYAAKSPAVMGMRVYLIAGDEAHALARITEVLEYVARSPRHLSRLRRTLSSIAIGAPVRHGRYAPQIRACNLAVGELQALSTPALAATLIHAVTEARLRCAVFDRRKASAEEWHRLPIICARASSDFLDRVQRAAA